MDFTSNPNAPFIHEQLEKLALDEIGSGLIAAFDIDDAIKDGPMYALGVAFNVHPKAVNLLLASPHLYRTVRHQYQSLEIVKNNLEAINKTLKEYCGKHLPTVSAMVEQIDQTQELAIRACRCVTEGINKVAAEIIKETGKQA